uniref:Pentatricopeptide repeat-containing protein At2g20710-like isoform X1 n=1 Tax=Rhizophora mucronata TaxID=61149 RepID=A0A2P2JEC9_RHIMU
MEVVTVSVEKNRALNKLLKMPRPLSRHC